MNYILRLDDACEKRNIENWDRIERLLDQYSIKPLVGVIPYCEDLAMDKYSTDNNFWERVDCWRGKGWTIAMHGYNHVYVTKCGGINPVNARSEFAGVPLKEQRIKIAKGIEIMRLHGLDPQVFFAPSHTFDENTLIALKEESNIKIISDTIANKPYCKYGFTFVPQQSGKVRTLPLNTVTFCYHPNEMENTDYIVLENFIKKHKDRFVGFPLNITRRRFNVLDLLLKIFYFVKR